MEGTADAGGRRPGRADSGRWRKRGGAGDDRDARPSWGKRIVAFVGFVGVLVGIVTGVVSLLPNDGPAVVQLDRVELQPMRLSEYEARAATVTAAGDGSGALPAALALAAQTVDAATAQDAGPTPDATGTPAPEATATPEGTATPEATPDATATATPDETATPDDAPTGTQSFGAQRFERVEAQLKLDRGGAGQVDKTLRLVEEDLANADLGACGPTDETSDCAMLPIVSEIVDPDGSAATAAEAARRVVSILRGARSIRTRSGTEVLGVTVDFDLTLTGYGSEDVRIAWSMYRTDGRPLPERWLREVTVLRIRIGGDEPEQVSGRFWVPLPRARARYKIQLTVYDGEGVARGHVRTRAFAGPDRDG